MPGLVATLDGAVPEEQRPRHPPGRVHLAEPRLLRLQVGRLGPVAVDVPLDHRVPARRQQVRQLVPHVAVGQGQAAGQDHQVLIVIPAAFLTETFTMVC